MSWKKRGFQLKINNVINNQYDNEQMVTTYDALVTRAEDGRKDPALAVAHRAAVG